MHIHIFLTGIIPFKLSNIKKNMLQKQNVLTHVVSYLIKDQYQILHQSNKKGLN